MVALLVTVFQLHCAQVGDTDAYLQYGSISYRVEGQTPFQMASFQAQNSGELQPHPLCVSIQTRLNAGQYLFECAIEGTTVLDCQ